MNRLLGYRKHNYRFVVMAFLVIIWFIVYMLRINVSVLLVDTRFLSDMGLQGKGGMQGLLMTFFLIPYALTNIVAAPLGDRIGPRKSMLLGIIIGAAGSIAAGLAPTFACLLLARLVIGIGQAIHFPTQSVFVKNWFPPRERGVGNALCAVGGYASTLATIPLFTWLFSQVGWEYTLALMGLVSLIPALPLVLRLVTDTPKDNAYVSPEERDYIIKLNMAECSGQRAEKGAVGQVVRSGSFWLVTLAYLSYLAVWWGLVTWLPQYFVQARGFDLHAISWATALPYATAMLAVLAGGALSDRVRRRSLLGFFFLAGSAVCIILAAVVPSAGWCIFLISVGLGCNVVYYPIAWALLQAMLPADLMGTGSGIMNGVSNLLSAITPFAMGLLIEGTGTYSAGLLLLASAALLGAFCSLTLIRSGK